MTTRITINGRTTVVSGSGTNVSVSNGRVTVNGQVIESNLQGTVDIRWEGPAATIEADGNVQCGTVDGNVSAGGNIRAGAISGNVNAGGNIDCGDVAGRVNAGGNVSRR